MLMDAVFSKILSMSLSACFVIVAVLFFRFLLRRAPRKYSYMLWMLVFFRLLCPLTLESPVSLVPVKADAIVYQSSSSGSSLKVDSGIRVIDTMAARGISGTFNKDPGTGMLWDRAESPLSALLPATRVLWVLGMAVLLGYGMIQVLRLKYRLRTAVLVSDAVAGNCPIPVYESEYIRTAFLLGWARPRIYLPLGIGEDAGYVIAHEQMHKKRLDHMVKPVCYLAVVLHWFNPLVWLAFRLMNGDMEMSCDEQVLKSAMEDIRGGYSRSLLKLSVRGSGLRVPLAFGEGDTKGRIQHALKYKKPSAWIGIGAIVIFFAAAVTLLTVRGGNSLSGRNSSPEAEKDMYEQLSESRNPYIGDASADGRLIGILPGIEGYEWDGMQLQTTTQPYELEMHYKKTEPVSVKEEQQNAKTMWRNAMYLFATIENMDIVSFVLKDWEDTEEPQIMSYTRETMEQSYGELYERSRTSDGLRGLEADYLAREEEMAKLLESTYDAGE